MIFFLNRSAIYASATLHAPCLMLYSFNHRLSGEFMYTPLETHLSHDSILMTVYHDFDNWATPLSVVILMMVLLTALFGNSFATVTTSQSFGDPGRIAEPDGSAVINWLLEGPQQNYYVSRKGLGALTKKKPVPHLEFYYFGFQMENNFQKHNFVVARLCEPMRFPDVPRTIITTRPN